MKKKNDLLLTLEKRKAQRIISILKIKYTTIGQKSKVKNKTKCIDISGEGISIHANSFLKIGDKLEVSFFIPTFNKTITAIGKVVWAKKEKNSFKAGLQFVKIEFESEFMEFICEQMINLSLG